MSESLPAAEFDRRMAEVVWHLERGAGLDSFLALSRDEAHDRVASWLEGGAWGLDPRDAALVAAALVRFHGRHVVEEDSCVSDAVLNRNNE